MNATIFRTSILAGLLVLAAGAALAQEQDLADARKLAGAQNAFAADLYAQLRRQQGNLFFSPYSIATAMGMTYAGAKGDTAAEMAKALHLEDLRALIADHNPPLRVVVLDRSAKLYKLLNEPRKEGLELHAANALWGKPNYPFNQDFIKSIKTSFDGNLEPVDFSNEPAARKKINDWVAGQTKEKIKDLIAPKVLTADTRLVLTNAIYFKAAWEEQFRNQATQKEKFHLSPDKDVDAQMMKATRNFSLAELEGFKLLVIPYKGNQAAMLVLLPDKVDGLADLEKSLSAEKLASWLEKAKGARVALSLPKFKSTCSFDLNKPLTGLGMKRAFVAGQADFTGIADVPDEPLYIGLVVHKAFVDVNEEGTEAAAATAVVMKAGSAMRPAEPVPFVADHPFVYVIRDNRTGDILFMGRLADPSKQGE